MPRCRRASWPGCSPRDSSRRVHLLAVLLTSNAALIDVLEDSRLDIPANILQNARADGHRLTAAAFNPRRRSEDFLDFLGELVGLVDNRPSERGGYDGVVVLYSHDAASHVVEIRDGIFASGFDGYAFVENRDNFLVRSFGRLIRNLLALMDTMRDKTRMEAAILPARNFDSEVFRAFLQFCEEEAAAPDFPNRVAPVLTAVTRLRGPRRRSTYPTKYFRDDRTISFQYGHEMHSSFETGGDHTAVCSIRGLFRLGVPLEQQRHFNVMSGVDATSISGSYRNCHTETVTFVDRTHLNMFSNDFLK